MLVAELLVGRRSWYSMKPEFGMPAHPHPFLPEETKSLDSNLALIVDKTDSEKQLIR